MKLLYDLTILLLGIHAREMKAYVRPKNCTRMFTTALFIMARMWKQPKCPSADDGMNKMWDCPCDGIPLSHKKG